MHKDDAPSPIAITESIIITAVINAKQERLIMIADFPSPFVRTEIGHQEIGQRICVTIVDILIELSPETYASNVVYDGKSKMLYVQMEKALYGMLLSSLLYYKKSRKDIESIGFKVNRYDLLWQIVLSIQNNTH
jgi:hypothetical protein